jgi:hypothetical protein
MILVEEKTRIIPAKLLRFPDSELQAALLFDTAVCDLVKNFDRKIQIKKTYLSTASKIVSSWIGNYEFIISHRLIRE